MVFYTDVRLPGDQHGQGVLLKQYLDNAIVLKVDEGSCTVSELKLLRLKLRPGPLIGVSNADGATEVVPFRRPSQIGCNLRHEFMLREEQGLWCKIYRRVRWEDGSQRRKYKDWKIKVVQLNVEFTTG